MEDDDYENSSGEVSDRAKKRCRVVNNLLTSVARDRTEEYWPSVVFARTERSEVCTATNRDKREFKQRRRLRVRQRHEARMLLVKKGKILVLHVQHEFPCIFLPYSIKQREITKF